MSKETTDMEYPSPQQHLLGTYEEILRVVCGHLELPQSESGPADDVRLYDRALEALDEYSCKADAELAENKRLRFKAEAEVVRLRKALTAISETQPSGHLDFQSPKHSGYAALEIARAALTTEGQP